MPPFALNDQHIVDAQRLRQRQLQSGNQIAEHRPRGDAGDDADHASRGQQAGADLARTGKSHQHQRHPGDQNHEAHGARDEPRLRVNAPGLKVVFDIERVFFDDALRQTAGRALRQPRQTGQQQQPIGVTQRRNEREGVGCSVPDSLQRQHRQRQARGSPDAFGDHAGNGQLPGQPPDQGSADPMHDQRQHHRQQRH